jgi:hypothetical protein
MAVRGGAARARHGGWSRTAEGTRAHAASDAQLYSRQRWREGKGVRHGRPSMARDAGGLNGNQGEALIGGETDGSYEGE